MQVQMRLQPSSLPLLHRAISNSGFRRRSTRVSVLSRDTLFTRKELHSLACQADTGGIREALAYRSLTIPSTTDTCFEIEVELACLLSLKSACQVSEKRAAVARTTGLQRPAQQGAAIQSTLDLEALRAALRQLLQQSNWLSAEGTALAGMPTNTEALLSGIALQAADLPAQVLADALLVTCLFKDGLGHSAKAIQAVCLQRLEASPNLLAQLDASQLASLLVVCTSVARQRALRIMQRQQQLTRFGQAENAMRNGEAAPAPQPTTSPKFLSALCAAVEASAAALSASQLVAGLWSATILQALPPGSRTSVRALRDVLLAQLERVAQQLDGQLVRWLCGALLQLQQPARLQPLLYALLQRAGPDATAPLAASSAAALVSAAWELQVELQPDLVQGCVLCVHAEVADRRELGAAGALMGALLPYMHNMDAGAREAALRLVLDTEHPSCLTAFCLAAAERGDSIAEVVVLQVFSRLAEVAPFLPGDVLPAVCRCYAGLRCGNQPLALVLADACASRRLPASQLAEAVGHLASCGGAPTHLLWAAHNALPAQTLQQLPSRSLVVLASGLATCLQFGGALAPVCWATVAHLMPHFAAADLLHLLRAFSRITLPPSLSPAAAALHPGAVASTHIAEGGAVRVALLRALPSKVAMLTPSQTAEVVYWLRHYRAAGRLSRELQGLLLYLAGHAEMQVGAMQGRDLARLMRGLADLQWSPQLLLRAVVLRTNGSPQVLQSFSQEELVWFVSSFGRLRYRGGALRRLLRTALVIATFRHIVRRQRLDCLSLALLAWTAGHCYQQRHPVIEQVVGLAMQQWEQAAVRGTAVQKPLLALGLLSWASGRLALMPSLRAPDMGSWLLHRSKPLLLAGALVQPWTLAQIMWGIATLGSKPSGEYLQALRPCLQSVVPRMEPAELATCCWVLAGWGVASQGPQQAATDPLLVALAARLEHLAPSCDLRALRNLCSIACALTRMGCRLRHAVLSSTCDRVMVAVQQVEVDDDDVLNLLWACEVVQYRPGALLQHLATTLRMRLQQDRAKWPSMGDYPVQGQYLAAAATSLALHGYSDDALWRSMEWVALRRPKLMTGNCWPGLLWAFATAGHFPSMLLQSQAQLLRSMRVQVPSWDLRDLSRCIWAISRLSLHKVVNFQHLKALLKAVDAALLALPGDAGDNVPVCVLVDFANGYSRLPHYSCKVLEQLADWAASAMSRCNTKGASALLAAYGTLKHEPKHLLNAFESCWGSGQLSRFDRPIILLRLLDAYSCLGRRPPPTLLEAATADVAAMDKDGRLEAAPRDQLYRLVYTLTLMKLPNCLLAAHLCNFLAAAEHADLAAGRLEAAQHDGTSVGGGAWHRGARSGAGPLHKSWKWIAGALLVARADGTRSHLTALPRSLLRQVLAAWRTEVAGWVQTAPLRPVAVDICCALRQLDLLPSCRPVVGDMSIYADVAVIMPDGKRVALEVMAQRITTSVNTLRLSGWGSLRRRLLESQGYNVLYVPVYHWQGLGRGLPGSKSRYMQQLLLLLQDGGGQQAVPLVPEWDM